MAKSLDSRIDQLATVVPPPTWQSHRRSIDAVLPPATELVFGAQGVGFPQGVRALIGQFGDTPQRKHLEALTDDELRRLVEDDRLPIPIPPDRQGYWGDRHLQYWLSGLGDYLLLSELIGQRSGAEPPRLFDFGCASGRVLRHFAVHDRRAAELLGSDIDRVNVDWARSYLPPAATVFQNTVVPPLPLPQDSIDFLWACSVFTHVDEFEEAWLLELRRILRPGGRAFLSVHRERTWSMIADPAHFMHERLCRPGMEVAGKPELRIDQGLFAQPMPQPRVVLFDRSGIHNIWTFHSSEYLAARWGRIFEIERVIERGHGMHQDAILLRKS